MTGAPVLEVDNLTVALRTARGMRRAVDGVSFTIGEGEILGVAGESGSGKTITALSLLGLLPIGARTSGSVRFQGRELLGLSRKQLREVRGKQVALVSQDPATSLHPLLRIDVQMTEHVRAHLGFFEGASSPARHRNARRGADPRPRIGPFVAPAPVFRRDAATDRNCHGARLRAAATGGRRADHRPRCHRASRDLAALGPAPSRTRGVGHDHHARPRGDVDGFRPDLRPLRRRRWPSTAPRARYWANPATPIPRA